MLDAEREMLLDALTRLTRRAEWSIKMMIDSQGLEEALRRRSPLPAGAGISGAEQAAPGHAFFERKKLAQRSRQEARSVARTTAAQVDARLREHSVASHVLPPLRRELSGESGEMVLNAAYLVDRAAQHAFATEARELAARHDDLAIKLTIRGPWAPYNFVSIPTEPK
jgi:hypothetical protein